MRYAAVMLDPVPHDAPDEPVRVLGLVDATCIVIGAIVGVGIFFTPTKVAALCPTSSLMLLAWCLGGAIALCGALAFAELGGMYRGAGAQYELLRDSYGPFPAFLFVFCISTVIEPGSIAVMAIICIKNLLRATGGTTMNESALAAGLIALLTIANVVGVRLSATIQNATVFAKLLTLLVIVALAMFFAPSGPAPSVGAVTASPSSGLIAGVLAALVPTLYSYGGWQQVLWVAGEVRQPRRTLPRSIIVGVIVVIVVYLLANWAYLHLLGVDGVAHSESLAADSVGAVFPRWGMQIAAAAVAVSAFGVLNVQLLTAPRLTFAMARDGRFFRPFASLHARFGTPTAAIALLTAIAISMLFVAGAEAIDNLVSAVVVVDSVFFVLSGLAVIVLRRKKPGLDRPVRVLGYPVVPLLFALGETGAIVGSFLEPAMRTAAIISAAWIAAAAIVYYFLFRTRPEQQAAAA